LDFDLGAIAKRSINFSCLIRNKSDFLNPKNRPVSLVVYGFVQKTVYQWRSMKRPFFNQKILALVPAENGK